MNQFGCNTRVRKRWTHSKLIQQIRQQLKCNENQNEESRYVTAQHSSAEHTIANTTTLLINLHHHVPRERFPAAKKPTYASTLQGQSPESVEERGLLLEPVWLADVVVLEVAGRVRRHLGDVRVHRQPGVRAKPRAVPRGRLRVLAPGRGKLP